MIYWNGLYLPPNLCYLYVKRSLTEGTPIADPGPTSGQLALLPQANSTTLYANHLIALKKSKNVKLFLLRALKNNAHRKEIFNMRLI